ncbi:hypothetical protein [Paenirhodobacter enshiensis]|uniref:DUF1376 domain-containing protein n=1 Tax=Paenirhodobacter enshiensis TaxID=1105367 RepID=A0A086XQ33_9RHOB|nr:hypothetical protein [Paenirhodobacter enshiensis]KFI24133.1 hypothetical protein CG50_15415 [Paenirhodobacter enshiensis]
MAALPNLTVVGGESGLPLYPIPTGLKLERHFFMQFRHRDWMKSEFRNLASREVRAVAIDLFCVAYDEDPAGTLPANEELIARLVDVPLDDWRGLCSRSIGPLDGWQKCRTDTGALRLFHPAVLEMVTEASKARRDHIERKAADRERKRLEALPDQMRRAGASSRMAEDTDLIVRLDEYLLEHFPPPTQRRPQIVRQALEEMDTAGRSAGL